MTTIGIYDSGIGGLTTAKIILERFGGNDLYYLADNLNHPFGNTNEDRLKETVRNGIKHVRAHSDIVVLACNTASSVTDDSDVIKLLPPIDEFEHDAENTLVMATKRTLSMQKDLSAFKVANTSELATLIEIHASLGCRRGTIDMSELLPYFEERLSPFNGVKNVILGCSHYLFCKQQICDILGEVNFFDGNERLCKELEKQVETRPDMPSKITFDFTAHNDEKKYKKILSFLMH